MHTYRAIPRSVTVLRDLVGMLASSGNRFVLSTRYVARAHRLLRDAPEQFEIIHVAPLTAADFPSPELARVETWVGRGVEVSALYDPLLAKLIVTAPTRAEAVAKLAAALATTRFAGIETNLDYLRHLVAAEAPDRVADCLLLGGEGEVHVSAPPVEGQAETDVPDDVALDLVGAAAEGHH